MSKRTATTTLNHINWNDKEEPEDAGVFQMAPEDVIKKRVIKTARRRNPISTEETPSASVFGNFSGFASKPAPAPSKAFSFLNNINSKNTEVMQPSNGTNAFETQKEIPTNSPLFKSFKSDDKPKDKITNEVYLGKVKGLNESVSEWIASKVNENPYVDLQPIFKDYSKYFDQFKKESDTDKSKPDFSLCSFKPPEHIEQKDPIKTTSNSSLSSIDKPDQPKPLFSFSLQNKEPEKQLPKFTFGVPSTTATTSAATIPMFSFGSNATPTFTPPTQSKTNEDPKPEDSEDHEEPPSNQFTPVVEDNSVFTTRCKVFVKNENDFGDRGVGTLYLKAIPNGEKFQLIVRADTNLGNLLCNFVLSKGIPMKRVGKKDVMLVAVPIPPVQGDSPGSPVPILLRVKSPEEADKLLAELERRKN